LSTDTPTVQNIYDGKGLAQQQSPNYAKGKIELFIGGTLPTRAMFETTPVYDENGNPVEPEPYPEGTPKPTPLANTWENLEGGRPNNSNTSHRSSDTERGISVLVCPVTGMRVTSNCPGSEVKTFRPGTEPKEFCTFHR